MKTHYTLGFLFSSDFDKVVLIRKNRPTWQAGRLNGIGGHIEDGETADDCMIREFKEEVAYDYLLLPPIWKHYATLDGPEFVVECFAATGQVSECHALTDEKVEIIYVNTIHSLRVKDMIENLPWLISMAIDFLHDGRPAFATIEYDESV